MEVETHGYPVEFDPRLVEESVLMAMEGSPLDERRQFRLDRDPLYELADSEVRESRFREHHARWFVRLQIPEPLFRALREEASLAQSISRCLVLPAFSAKEENADLHENRRRDPSPSPLRPVLVIRVRPRTLLDRDRLLLLLRQELLHVTDMLDPDFAYQPMIPHLDSGPSYENLLRDRYRVLWDTTIDGRLVARGMLPPGGEERRKQEFLATFSMLSPKTEGYFRRFFEGPRPRHGDLLAFAASPGGEGRAPESARSARCPLCRFPTVQFHPHPEILEPAVVSAIQQDFPGWRPELGLCLQCGDLYVSRSAPLAVE